MSWTESVSQTIGRCQREVVEFIWNGRARAAVVEPVKPTVLAEDVVVDSVLQALRDDRPNEPIQEAV